MWGGGTERLPHGCFSVVSRGSWAALTNLPKYIKLNKIHALACPNGKICAWLGLAVHELNLVNTDIHWLDLIVLTDEMHGVLSVPGISWVARIRLHLMVVVVFTAKQMVTLFLCVDHNTLSSLSTSRFQDDLYKCRLLRPQLTPLTWLILPVVICLSQSLSHACLSISYILRNCEWLIITVMIS